MSSRVQRVLCRGGVITVLVSGWIGLTGCGDGGGTTAAATAPASSGSSLGPTVTQSDIVLPSSVQVVTAK